jgi:hypothetical protein
MFVRAVLGLWWAILSAFAILGAHLWWAVARCEGSYLQRGGAALIILGIFVASLPYWRQRPDDLVQRQNPVRVVALTSESGTSLSDRRNAAMPQATEDVLTERYLGVFFIVLGTAINGYSDLILRSLGWVEK